MMQFATSLYRDGHFLNPSHPSRRCWPWECGIQSGVSHLKMMMKYLMSCSPRLVAWCTPRRTTSASFQLHTLLTGLSCKVVRGQRPRSFECDATIHCFVLPCAQENVHFCDVLFCVGRQEIWRGARLTGFLIVRHAFLSFR